MIQRKLLPGALPSIFPYKTPTNVERPGAVKRNRLRAIAQAEENLLNDLPCPSEINEEEPLTRTVSTQTERVSRSDVAVQACITPKRKHLKIQVDCGPNICYKCSNSLNAAEPSVSDTVESCDSSDSETIWS